jgi:hypothetical protein
MRKVFCFQPLLKVLSHLQVILIFNILQNNETFEYDRFLENFWQQTTASTNLLVASYLLAGSTMTTSTASFFV